MPKFFLPLFSLLLFILPLGNKLNHYSLPLFFFLLLFYGWVFWKQVRLTSSRAVVFCFLLSVLIVAVGLLGRYGPNWLEISRLLIAIWAIPAILELLKEYGSRKIGLVVVTILAVHALWGMGQFVIQRDLGLSRLGESRLSSTTDAVAKFTIGEHKLIRAYGPYPHSNSLAGALVVGVVLVVWLWLQRPSKQIELIGVAVLGGLLVSFSRAALLGLLIALGIVYIKKKQKMILKPRLFVVLGLITFSVFVPLYLFRTTDPHDLGVSQREEGYRWATHLIYKVTNWRGAGVGQYEVALTDYLTTRHIPHQVWEVEPVHDTPLLLLSEWGIGSVFLVTLLWYVRPTKPAVLVWLIPLLPLVLFDHYIATQTAPLILVMVLALLTSYEPPVVRVG